MIATATKKAATKKATSKKANIKKAIVKRPRKAPAWAQYTRSQPEYYLSGGRPVRGSRIEPKLDAWEPVSLPRDSGKRLGKLREWKAHVSEMLEADLERWERLRAKGVKALEPFEAKYMGKTPKEALAAVLSQKYVGISYKKGLIANINRRIIAEAGPCLWKGMEL